MSLRARLLLAVGVVAVLALGAADVATYSSLRSFLYHRVDQSLASTEAPIEEALAQNGMSFTGSATIVPLSATYVQIRRPDGDVRSTRPLVRQGRGVAPVLPDTIAGFSPDGPRGTSRYLTVASDPPGSRFRALATQLPAGDQLVLAVPLDDVQETLRRLLDVELAVTLAAVAVAAALGWWLVKVGLRPLADVEETAVAIAQGQLDRRVPGDRTGTEVGRLASALNTMLERIQVAFAQRDATEAALRRSEGRMRRFVGDASHELRTPLAAVAAYAELFERGASTHPEDLERLMAGIASEAGRMRELVEDLLLLARLDEGRPLGRARVELVVLVSEALEAARAVGPAWPVRLEASQPVEVIGDASRLRQVIDNLLANVRAHTPPGTNTVVHLATSGPDAIVSVADDGPGLSDDQAGQVFERFYRADTARTRDRGGAGLGLAIVAGIVGAHRGSVWVTGTPGGGATFTLRLPAAPDPAAPDPAAPDPAVAAGADVGPAGTDGVGAGPTPTLGSQC